MLGSNATVNSGLKLVSSQVRASFTIVDVSGKPEDIEKMFDVYERSLKEMRDIYQRDTEFHMAVKANPYTADYTYGHFLALVKARFLQCTTLDEREVVRLKYYPYIGPNADVSAQDWKPMIDALLLHVSEDSPFMERLLSIITFGQYKRTVVVRQLSVEKQKAPTAALPAPTEQQTA